MTGQLFTADHHVYDLPALLEWNITHTGSVPCDCFSVSFLFSGFSIFCSSFFTALNDGLTSALISFLRTLVFQCAAVLIFPLRWALDGIWWSIVAAEGLALAAAGLFLAGKRKAYHY